jgi:hypothetical protein
MYPIRTRQPPRMLPRTTNIPANGLKADARTRTGDPFITSYGPLSLSVIRSHLRSLAGSPGLEMTHDDWR